VDSKEDKISDCIIRGETLKGIKQNTGVGIDDLMKIVLKRKLNLFFKMYVCKTKGWNIVSLITGVQYNPIQSYTFCHAFQNYTTGSICDSILALF
jgi:hypothetical protein